MKRREFLSLGGLTAAGLTLTGYKNHNTTDTKQAIPEDHIREKAADIPVRGKYDVIVCGGGPAGIAAAITAARQGAKTLLIEAGGCLGGTWTAGLLPVILDYENKGDLLKEIIDGLSAMNAQNVEYPTGAINFDIEGMKLLLERLCLAAGVDILLHTRVANVVMQKKQISHILTESKSFREAWQTKVVIDCSGDGDVGALAGCEFELGKDEQQSTQPMSFLGLISGIRHSEIGDHVRGMIEPWKNNRRLKEKMIQGGVEPSYRNPMFFPIRKNLFSLMATHQYSYKGTNARDLTEATLSGRRELHALVAALRSHGGPWKDIMIVATPEHIGVREGRRIKGLYTVSQDDLVNGARFDDAIVRVKFGVDVHNLKKDDDSPNSQHIKSQPYDIPLRSLIAKDVDNLLMAGRCISGDFIAHASYRVTGNAVPMGEAAGQLAAAAIQHKQLPKSVSWESFKAAKQD